VFDRAKWFRQLRKTRREKGLCTRCGKINDRFPKWECTNCAELNTIRSKVIHLTAYYRNKPIKLEQGKRYRDKRKLEVIQAYGGKCSCCGESNIVFLTIDHIAGNGSKHLTPKGKRYMGNQLYNWLKQNNYPKGFQVLCWNCNLAKHILGQCPHQIMEVRTSEEVMSNGR
jgi:hypothetical protein